MVPVYKSSKVKLLRPHEMGLTFGALWAVCVLVLTVVALASRTSTSASSGLIELFKVIYPGYRVTFAGSAFGLLWGFGSGYIFGFLIAWLYCWWL